MHAAAAYRNVIDDLYRRRYSVSRLYHYYLFPQVFLSPMMRERDGGDLEVEGGEWRRSAILQRSWRSTARRALHEESLGWGEGDAGMVPTSTPTLLRLVSWCQGLRIHVPHTSKTLRNRQGLQGRLVPFISSID